MNYHIPVFMFQKCKCENQIKLTDRQKFTKRKTFLASIGPVKTNHKFFPQISPMYRHKTSYSFILYRDEILLYLQDYEYSSSNVLFIIKMITIK